MGEPFSEAELLGVIIPILDGLEQVHEQGFIHRDIKPQNIVVQSDGRPVLIDFGSARQAMGEQTRTLTSLISPGFSPLEQYHQDIGDQGPWTDIYALGATLYTGATGKKPADALQRSAARSGKAKARSAQRAVSPLSATRSPIMTAARARSGSTS